MRIDVWRCVPMIALRIDAGDTCVALPMYGGGYRWMTMMAMHDGDIGDTNARIGKGDTCVAPDAYR